MPTPFKSSMLTVLVISMAVSTALSTSSFINITNTDVAPLYADHHPYGTVNNSYIIMLKDDISNSIKFKHMAFIKAIHDSDPLVGDDMAGVNQVYDGHISGYAGHFNDHVIDRIRRRPEVAYVEKDQIVRTQSISTQKDAPWGLARISHRARLTFGTFSRYIYDDKDGDGVDVYIIDTGINIEHVAFEGRARWGKTIITNAAADEDENGHGTHCAGIVASNKYGVAKKANVVAIKVLGSDGRGTMSDVIGGIVYTVILAERTAGAAAEEFNRTGHTHYKGSVVNLSLSGGKSPSLDKAINVAIDSGMHFAVAAGNENENACDYSPSSAQRVITVGASSITDERAYFSNHGPCVDVFAPALNIASTYIGTTFAIVTFSGTSVASAHTAGVIASLLSRSSVNSPSITPAQLKRVLLSLSTPNRLSDIPPSTVNLLIFNNATRG